MDNSIDESLTPTDLAQVSNVSEGSLGWDDNSNRNGLEVENVKETMGHTGLSPCLKRLLTKPVDDEGYLEMRKLLRETINLTRAAISRGLMKPGEGDILIDPITENWFYKCMDTTVSNTMSNLVKKLDLNACEVDDLLMEYEVNKPDRRKKSVLVLGGEIFQVAEPERMSTIHDRRGVIWAPARYRAGGLSNSPVLDTEEKLDKYVENVLKESEWAVIGRKKETEAWGNATPTSKRKVTSPTLQSDNILRLRRNDGSSSPALRARKAPMCSPQEKKVSSPPFNGVNKGKRKTYKLKRCLNPGLKQQLITSAFSPRVTKEGEGSQGKDQV